LAAIIEDVAAGGNSHAAARAVQHPEAGICPPRRSSDHCAAAAGTQWTAAPRAGM